MAQRLFTILFVDDDPAIISSLQRTFFEDDYCLLGADGGESALALLAEQRVDAALVDLKMPGLDGHTLLQIIHQQFPQTKVIMLTGHGGVEDAVKAMQAGACDFLQKPFCQEVLRNRIAQLYQIWFLEEENRRLSEGNEYYFSFSPLLGSSSLMAKLKEMIVKIAHGEASVLIQGETGTGKELVAKALHHHSERSANPFVVIDCGALSETVIESELFGHKKGAFTGAQNERIGLFRAAHQGTLFLDEVGEFSLAMQVKLLRTLQERQVRPLGGQKSIPVDVRIVAATNRDLREDVSAGRFREDLYYRLQVFTLEVPALRQRLADIPLLARSFIKLFATDRTTVTNVSTAALSAMEAYPWPGNVRELENVIRRAVILGREPEIRFQDLPPHIADNVTPRQPPAGDLSPDSLAAHEKMAISDALFKACGNRRQAAAILGIGEATLYRKLKKYRIDDFRS
ncbi:MAG: sigma-54 dependent transcriptional regulator [Pseudomonadota bacterium]|nr:sigma-54 dependent transcriptional regulator [Pseudomonadota bacterium]